MERSAGVASLDFCYTPPDVPTAPPDGCALTKVDFSKDDDGKPLSRGDYVSNQWADFGLVLGAMGGFGNKPRLFDTANPGTANKGDPDLGAPNYACPVDKPGRGQGNRGRGQGYGNKRGPGIGDGGKPGKPGENCEEQGLALIIQEENKFMSIPDDNADGGVIIMDFTKPGGQYVKDLGLLDIDYDSFITVEYETASGSIASYDIVLPMLGDNSYQVVEIDQENVKWLKLNFDRSGAVTFIRFCQDG